MSDVKQLIFMTFAILLSINGLIELFFGDQTHALVLILLGNAFSDQVRIGMLEEQR